MSSEARRLRLFFHFISASMEQGPLVLSSLSDCYHKFQLSILGITHGLEDCIKMSALLKGKRLRRLESTSIKSSPCFVVPVFFSPNQLSLSCFLGVLMWRLFTNEVTRHTFLGSLMINLSPHLFILLLSLPCPRFR